MVKLNTCVIINAGTNDEYIAYIIEAYHSDITGELVYTVETEKGDVRDEVTRDEFIIFAA